MPAWLGLERENGAWNLTDHNTMRQIINEIDDPTSQYPSIQLFLGQNTKMQALRSLFPCNNIGRHQKDGFARMHLSGGASSYPIFFVECSRVQETDPSQPLKVSTYRHHLPNTRRHSCQDVQALLYRCLLLPLVDTVCLFAADFGSIRRVQSLLGLWSQTSMVDIDGQGHHLRPRLVVVLTEEGDKESEVNATVTELWATAVPNLVASVSIVDLRNRSHLSSLSRFEPLRRHLSLELDEARAARTKAHLLFSATHMEWIFRKLLRHIAESPSLPFELMKACRPRRSGGDEIARYLKIFLDIAEQGSIPPTLMATFIASAYLMDAYPPKMHGFDPAKTFRYLYGDVCEAACTTSPYTSPHGLHNHIEREFVSLFSTISMAGGRSAQVRRKVFWHQKSAWSAVKTNRICLFCLRCSPEHVLPCGHSICDVCPCIFGSRGEGAEYHIQLTSCPACLECFTFTIRLLPPTKGPTILALDGGGVRGVVTLGFLKALEDQISCKRGLREAFDLTMGTSAGAVIASELMVRETCVSEAHTKFEALAQQIFPLRPRRQTVLGQSWDWLMTWATDSRHNSGVLDRTLQEAFGRHHKLFDTPISLLSGVRVALTASQVEDGSLSLFTNYRSAGRSGISSSYKVIAPGEEPLLWEIARCSVAALGYFTPKHLPGIGIFQDGGVRANCPLRAALRECEIIWPWAKRPDLVVSIGTGYTPETSTSLPDKPGYLMHDRFIKRAVRAFMSSPAVDSQRGWQDAWDSIHETFRPDTFRLDRPIAGQLPELDDARALGKLGEFDYRIPQELIRVWLVKSLFFELDEEPIMAHGHYECHGSILCCKYDATNIIQQIMSQFPGSHVQFSDGTDIGSLDDHQGCAKCGYYRKRVFLRVSNIHETVQLRVGGVTGSSALGGFPTSIYNLLDQQLADFPFGRADHRNDLWPPLRQCYCTGRKRPRNLMQTDRAYKRRRQ
ncbi:patatin-like phospholipase family protein [Aspergillus affinis]|uniref:patatin-like phospholipase family protein n=1 Tax=Aspergillus affinis TaxID=1070780 RepID=UPI0022FE29D8|nr:uncharacterized protein KD926_004827 [Aspergillus affinis]KAI9035013.1 hypothetical protein KD926_004827 [Aspergillus affinis]